MTAQEKILEIVKQKGKVVTREIADQFGVSRQYASSLLAQLVAERQLVKTGSTRKAAYLSLAYAKKNRDVLSHRYVKRLKNVSLEEHKVLAAIERDFPLVGGLSDNVKSIFAYAFSEMLNNAIEHSRSSAINIQVAVENKRLSFVVDDYGIGVFRNIKKKRKLRSELEAIQDLLKGKTTTMPKAHSGEGIFFTSKVGDVFILDSFGHQLIVNNELPDVFVKKTGKIKKGTKVTFDLSCRSKRHLNSVFNKYTNVAKGSDYGFDKTEIRVKLYTVAGVHVSRSQARRVLAGLEKFKVILFDFDKVPMVGQAFADEIFRVFHHRYPRIRLETENMNEGVKFMVRRARNGAAHNI